MKLYCYKGQNKSNSFHNILNTHIDPADMYIAIIQYLAINDYILAHKLGMMLL